MNFTKTITITNNIAVLLMLYGAERFITELKKEEINNDTKISFRGGIQLLGVSTLLELIGNCY